MQPQNTGASCAGDNDANALLYDRYGQVIFAYMRLHTPSREDAEDLTLEVFLAALERNNLADLIEEERLVWLRRVARNKVIDAYRRANRHPAVELDRLVETISADEQRGPEQSVLRQEEYAQLRAAIDRLPTLQQQILQLRFGNNLRLAEIAALLNKREAAVRKQLSRTLAFLRSQYDYPQQEQSL